MFFDFYAILLSQVIVKRRENSDAKEILYFNKKNMRIGVMKCFRVNSLSVVFPIDPNYWIEVINSNQ